MWIGTSRRVCIALLSVREDGRLMCACDSRGVGGQLGHLNVKVKERKKLEMRGKIKTQHGESEEKNGSRLENRV